MVKICFWVRMWSRKLLLRGSGMEERKQGDEVAKRRKWREDIVLSRR